MKLAILGVTGNVGSKIAAEALSRNHEVLGLARNVSGVAPQPRLTVKAADLAQESSLTTLLRGQDALISALKFASFDHPALLRVAKNSGVKRLLVVGGAGSLEVAPGKALVDTPNFPAEYKAEASAARDFLELIRREADLNWTFLSPSALLLPGERTGKFRLGGDQLLVAANGESRISIEDFAIAMVDELESGKHHRQRFTVGY